MHLFFFLGLLFACKLAAADFSDIDVQSRLMEDLLIVDYWNERLNERFAVTYNHLLQAGYFAMPSARMGPDGEFGIGYASAPPYRNYNVRCQIQDFLEVTANYRVFDGVKDPVLSPFGFGDFSDKGLNIKLALLRPEDSDYELPGLAIGYEDVIGTKAFHAKYVVLTKVFLKQNVELTLGWGTDRIKGFFGGVNWMPFRKSCSKLLRELSFAAEYDATPYKRAHIEKHPGGRVKKSPINAGVKLRLLDHVDLSLSYIRGTEVAFSLSTFYNFGYTTGFLPKIDDPLPYSQSWMCFKANEQVSQDLLNFASEEEKLVQELKCAFSDQGFEVLNVAYTADWDCQKGLSIHLLNETYRREWQVRERLNDLLACLIPADVATVTVVMFSEGFPIQQYTFSMDFVRLFAAGEMGGYELELHTPLHEVVPRDLKVTTELFSSRRSLFNFELAPRTYTFFGSATGKFKYSLGLNVALNGFLPREVYYNVICGMGIVGNLHTCNDFDRLNPSQLLNVRTDIIRYYQQKGLVLEQAYLQKTWTLGRGWYARLGGGYFEIAYGGAAAELLYYPLKGRLAIGFEAALLKKRNYSGLGFTDKVRKFEGFCPTYHHFFGSQGFASLYYDWKEAHLDFKVSAGKFLAHDWGARFAVSRSFPSGLRLTVWYTRTNGGDRVNGETYYDKGIALTVPFDIFYTYSERTLWTYGMSAWLRDVGVQGYTGLPLYELINDQRQ